MRRVKRLKRTEWGDLKHWDLREGVKGPPW